MNTNKLIANFNSELAVVNYQLTQIFIYYIHLYVIHCIWKKIADKEFNDVNK